MRPLTLATAVVFVAGFAGVWAYPYLPALSQSGLAPVVQSPPKAEPTSGCEATEAIATVKQMASLKMMNRSTAEFLLRAAFPKDRENIITTSEPVLYSLSAFRNRGAFGAKGISCAAQVDLHLAGLIGSVAFSTEYLVEPTTDGKVMVSARFMPN